MFIFLSAYDTDADKETNQQYFVGRRTGSLHLTHAAWLLANKTAADYQHTVLLMADMHSALHETSKTENMPPINFCLLSLLGHR